MVTDPMTNTGRTRRQGVVMLGRSILDGSGSRVILTLASAGAGTVLGAAVQSWSVTPLRLTALTVASLSLLVIGLSTSIAAWNRTETIARSEVLDRVEQLRREMFEGFGEMGIFLARQGRLALRGC